MEPQSGKNILKISTSLPINLTGTQQINRENKPWLWAENTSLNIANVWG